MAGLGQVDVEDRKDRAAEDSQWNNGLGKFGIVPDVPNAPVLTVHT